MSKKFIFSAVALMAFSFAGMANEIEEKKVEKTTVKEKDCAAEYLLDFEKLENMDFTFDEAAFLAFQNYKRCKGL